MTPGYTVMTPGYTVMTTGYTVMVEIFINFSQTLRATQRWSNKFLKR